MKKNFKQPMKRKCQLKQMWLQKFRIDYYIWLYVPGWFGDDMMGSYLNFVDSDIENTLCETRCDWKFEENEWSSRIWSSLGKIFLLLLNEFSDLDQSTNSIERYLSKRLRTFNSMVSEIKWISGEISRWN
jgi:hypothetical protein